MQTKHVTTQEYVDGINAFTSGQDRVCPFNDKRRAARWDAGWEGALRSPTSQAVRAERIELARIALRELGIASLELRGRDSLDFRDLSVSAVARALAAAYAAGRASK